MKIGKKHVELAMRWTPSAMVYGVTAGLGLLYVIDWKLIVQHVPYYGGKFKE